MQFFKIFAKKNHQKIVSIWHSMLRNNITGEKFLTLFIQVKVLSNTSTYYVFTVMQEVQERMEFLQIMEQLGCKSKYEFDMTLEISEKLRRLENLSKQ